MLKESPQPGLADIAPDGFGWVGDGALPRSSDSWSPDRHAGVCAGALGGSPRTTVRPVRVVARAPRRTGRMRAASVLRCAIR